MEARPPALAVEGLSKTYAAALFPAWFSGRPGRGVDALRELSFTVARGEICGFLGANGAGKTTLFKILAGLILPDSGVIRMDGRRLDPRGLDLRRLAGLVSGEERSFYWRLSARENLRFFAAWHGLAPAGARRRVEELLEVFEVEEADRPVAACSSGMKQRLSLARGLLHDPPLLLLDEPTRSLDPLSAGHLRTLVRDTLCRGQGKTVLWATHQLAEAEAICDRLAVLREGRLAAFGTREELAKTAGLAAGAGLGEVFAGLVSGGG